MICFMDRTFCDSDCTNRECRRNFTPEMAQRAREWWDQDPDNAPVAFSDFKTGCPDYKQPEDETQ